MTEQRRPLISLVAINYIHIKDTIEFLESVAKLSYRETETIVVDNASPKGRPDESVKKRFPWVKFIQSEKNLGFAGGNNLGIAEASGDYIFLLNNDTLLPKDFLDPIVDFMQAHPDAGMASPKVLYPDETTIQYAGAIGINPVTGRGKRLGLFEKDNGQYDRNYETDLGHGAALIIRSNVVKAVGPMPELYFLYYEEHDWCMMMKRLGYKMYYIGESHIIHKESISTGGDDSPNKVYYLTRNRVIFMRRNFTGMKFFSGLLFFAAISVPSKLLKYLVRGKFALMGAVIRGSAWHLTHLGKSSVR
ncbi:MAG TPA: glycosyltransferase family 2 protein [Cyclobacteriaceae bacterium]|nr:glycosyltransferase family 2 protein [Cyclobacteriaceae bacterium]